MPNICECILRVLMEVSWAVYDGGWEYNHLPYIIGVNLRVIPYSVL